VIANAVLGKETIEVAPQNNLNARLVNFSAVYTTSPAKTAQIDREAIRQVENVSQKIRPIVRIRNLGDSGIEWEVKYWPENYALFNDTDALIRQSIWYAFQREGLHFAYPTRTIYREEKLEEVTFEEYVTSASEYLDTVPIFAPLSDEETQKLAKSSTRRIFAPGEMIVRKGQEGGSMFVIVRGSVKVQLPSPDGPKTINNLRTNDFFGEMSLLTGEPRSANVIADEETDVLQIRKTAIKPLFEANPELMKAISEIVEERRQLLAQNETEISASKATLETGVMSSIRKFFGMKD
jgi:small-conductance mechanosensitive channel